jgi:hypothetical protein
MVDRNYNRIKKKYKLFKLKFNTRSIYVMENLCVCSDLESAYNTFKKG